MTGHERIGNEAGVFIKAFVHPSNTAEASRLASALNIAVAGWLDAAPDRIEREAATMAGAIEGSLRSLTGKPVVPYLGSEARVLLAGELEGHALCAESRGAAVDAALARVLAAVLAAEVTDLVLGRVDPSDVQLLTVNERTRHPALATDLNRLLAVEEVVEQQILNVLPSAKVVDRVVQEGLLRFRIDGGVEGLDVIVVDYRTGGATDAS